MSLDETYDLIVFKENAVKSIPENCYPWADVAYYESLRHWNLSQGDSFASLTTKINFNQITNIKKVIYQKYGSSKAHRKARR